MRTRKVIVLFLSLAGLLFATWVATGQQARRVDDLALRTGGKTGEERWRWDPEVNQVAVRPKICCGIVNRGIAIYQGKIIAPVIDGRLEALDAETGKPVWEARVAFPQDNYTITMAPRIAKGKVII